MRYKLTLCFFSIIIIFNSNLSTQNLKNFLKKHYDKIEFNETLGKGGTGKVVGASNQNFALKIGKSKDQCNKIQQEFEVQNKIYNLVKGCNEDLLNRAIILKPKKLIQNKHNNLCLIELPRLYPIKEETNKNLITQLRLGTKNYDSIEKSTLNNLIKGHAIGVNKLKEIVSKYPKKTGPKTNLEQLFADVGQFLGILHYKAKLDCLDVELCIARENKEVENYKLAFLDFGMCSDISNLFKKNKYKKIIAQLTKALTIEPIFPNPTTPEFKIFMEEYIKVAKINNLKNIAKKIMHNFISEQFIKNKIIKSYLTDNLKIRSSSFQFKKFIEILSSWTNKKLLNKIQKGNYNVKTKNINNYLKKIIPKITAKKEKEKNLDRIEKILLSKLKK